MFGEFAAVPRREGACPFRQGKSRFPPTLGESASVQRIRPGFPVSDRVLRGKGKPFPYNETAADSPGDCWKPGVAARRAGVGAPYMSHESLGTVLFDSREDLAGRK